ncbi:anthocyanidin 3-O-glucosyltransferase 7-like [Selaginella moellendorffii]|uniref:anthocyanidin 3-O-glucosyltransferase 7-like n=1 Tax=Selaginella moellendorffii TaxID=88036 RepID=UPI000D1C338E|nr:anthocyanidin 3-O-glucosyltransferase 7-like [Selaginella moellendorffii]|eukprot:XP_024541918.1 anthocyanidin 3-O-glucosyltransferase 7-like [Selaginella moellendorffii]
MAMASHVPRLIAENAIKDPESIIKIPGLPDFQVRDYVTLSNVINPNFPMKFMIESLVDTVRRTAGADMILANSSGLLEDDAIKTLESSGIKVTPVGPLHLIDQDNDPKDPDKVISWLDEQDPASVLYICFGTVAPMPVGQMEELAMALDSTGVSFLWVVRHDHLKDIPPGFTAKHGISNGTNGTNGGTNGTNGGTNGCTARHRGLLTDWVTQPRVLGHRAVGGFLTHCGWNSVMESITAGVPMITRPLMGDQTLTAAMLRQASMPAIALPTSKGGAVTKTEIVAAIEELMVRERGAELRRRAGDAAALVRSGMENGGCSRRCLDSLVTELNILAKNPKIQHIRFA